MTTEVLDKDTLYKKLHVVDDMPDYDPMRHKEEIRRILRENEGILVGETRKKITEEEDPLPELKRVYYQRVSEYRISVYGKDSAKEKMFWDADGTVYPSEDILAIILEQKAAEDRKKLLEEANNVSGEMKIAFLDRITELARFTREYILEKGVVTKESDPLLYQYRQREFYLSPYQLGKLDTYEDIPEAMRISASMDLSNHICSSREELTEVGTLASAARNNLMIEGIVLRPFEGEMSEVYRGDYALYKDDMTVRYKPLLFAEDSKSAIYRISQRGVLVLARENMHNKDIKEDVNIMLVREGYVQPMEKMASFYDGKNPVLAVDLLRQDHLARLRRSPDFISIPSSLN